MNRIRTTSSFAKSDVDVEDSNLFLAFAKNEHDDVEALDVSMIASAFRFRGGLKIESAGARTEIIDVRCSSRQIEEELNCVLIAKRGGHIEKTMNSQFGFRYDFFFSVLGFSFASSLLLRPSDPF